MRLSFHEDEKDGYRNASSDEIEIRFNNICNEVLHSGDLSSTIQGSGVSDSDHLRDNQIKEILEEFYSKEEL